MIIIGPNQSINCSFFHTITLTNPTLLFCNFFLIVFLLHPLSSLFFYPFFHLHAFYSSSYSSRFFLLPNCSSLFLISFVPHSTTDQSVGSILLSQSSELFGPCLEVAWDSLVICRGERLMSKWEKVCWFKSKKWKEAEEDLK